MNKLRPLVLAASLLAAAVGSVAIAAAPAYAAAPTAPTFDNFGFSARDGLVAFVFEDQSSNEVGFRIQRRFSSVGSWQLVEEIPTTGAATYTVRYENQPLPLEQCYRVQAFNGDGASSSRSWCTEPREPDQLTVVSKTLDSVTLSWRDRAYNERFTDLYGGFASDHELGMGVIGHWGPLPDVNTITTFTVTGLRHGIVYEFSMTAVNNVGDEDTDPRLTVRI